MQTQKFLTDGTRIPVTVLTVQGNVLVRTKTKERDGYAAVQLGIGTKTKAQASLRGEAKKAHLESVPRFFREVGILGESNGLPNAGTVIDIHSVFSPGDIIDVYGISKGKGYAGVVKRYHFKGGPRTHGQSDRERAPGSIGQTTTPGRVYKGKRMAGKMGGDSITVRNLEVVGIDQESLLIKGLVPGGVGSMVVITKRSKNKKFIPLAQSESIQETVKEKINDAKAG